MAVAIGSRSLYCVDFAASGAINTNAALPALSPAISVSFWIKRSGVGANGEIVLESSAGVILQLYINSSGVLRWLINSSSIVTGTTSVVDGNRHHVLATCSAAGAQHLYIDGNLDASTTGSSVNGSGGVLDMGGRGVFLYLGKMDEVAVWATDQSANAANLAGGYIDPLALSPVGYWRLEEDTGTTVNDSSGNGHTATLSGAAVWATDAPTPLQDYASTTAATPATTTFNYRSSGVNRLLLVGVAFTATGGSASAVTVNGAAATFVGSVDQGTTRVELWRRTAPTVPGASALTVAVTTLGTGEAALMAVSLTGVSQTAPVESAATNSGTGAGNATLNVTTATTGDLVVAFLSTTDSTFSASGQTQILNPAGTTVYGAAAWQGPVTPPATVAATWTGIGAALNWGVIALGVRDATQPDPSPTSSVTSSVTPSATPSVSPSPSVRPSAAPSPSPSPSIIVSASPVPPSVSPTPPSVSPVPPSVSPIPPSLSPSVTPPSVSPAPPSVSPTPPSVSARPSPSPSAILPSVSPIPPSVSPVPPSVSPTPPSVSPTPPSVSPAPPSVSPTLPSVSPIPPSASPSARPSVSPTPPSVSPTPPSISPSHAPPSPSPSIFVSVSPVSISPISISPVSLSPGPSVSPSAVPSVSSSLSARPTGVAVVLDVCWFTYDVIDVAKFRGR